MADSRLHQKSCSACGETKPIDRFSSFAAYADGYRGQCKECRRAYQKRYSRTEEGKAAAKRYESAYKPKRRTKKLRYNYGITERDFQEMLDAQKHCCAICGTVTPRGRYNRFVVDHCHETGRVRGLLCHRCNVLLSRIGDDLSGVMRFVDYLTIARA